jgi:hypothetical protein
MEKQFSLLKPNAEQIDLLTSLRTQVFQLAHFTVENHKQFAPEPSPFSSNFLMQHLWQQMLQHVEFTWMEYHSLFT